MRATPTSAADIELLPRLTDAQAGRLWAQIAEERQSGHLWEFPNAAAAVRGLRGRVPRDAVTANAARGQAVREACPEARLARRAHA